MAKNSKRRAQTEKRTKKLKRRPAEARHLDAAAVAAPSGRNTLGRVIYCIEPYTSIRPIRPEYPVGALCQDLDFLGADLNLEFGLEGNQRYWRGEIEGSWIVRYLSDYTDLKKAALP